MIGIDKNILNKWINIDKISYLEISRRLKCSNTYVKKYAKKLGINLPKRGTHNTNPWNKGKKKVYTCKNCGKIIISKGNGFRQYCCLKCFSEFKRQEKYNDYLLHQDNFTKKEITYAWLKPIILKEQLNKCSICGIYPIWNNKDLHFVLDHIDGDATNNKRTNLRCICPNCDSQLDTYKSRNIGKSTRKYKPYRIYSNKGE